MKIKLLILFLFLFATTAFAQTQPPAPAPDPDSPEVLKKRIDNMQNRLNDWANFKRYRDKNAEVTPPAKDENRVVFYGDSITDGWKLAEYFPGKPYVNRGISGQTTPQMLLRFRSDVVAHKPKVVVLLAGTNDIAGNTGPMTLEQVQDNYASMAEIAKANGIKFVFSSILPVHDYNPKAPKTAGRPPEKILKLNEWMKNYCAANGHTYLDYFSKSVDDKGFLKAELAKDGLHPNEEGYKLMAPLAEAAIQVALKKKK